MHEKAAAHTVAQMIEGKSIDAAGEVTPENVIDDLETMPEENYHCAELAVGALYLALANYRK
jgi:nitrogen fixation NifU-like protein